MSPESRRATRLERIVIEHVPLNSVKPNAYNPNRQSDHDFELLIRSMTEDGFTQPVIVDRATREIVDGEHRWTASIVREALRRRTLQPDPATLRRLRDDRAALLEAFGAEVTIPVVFVDMTPEQRRVATLRHNRARGSEELQLTAEVLRDLRDAGAIDWARDSLMLDEVETRRLLDDVAVSEVRSTSVVEQLLAGDAEGVSPDAKLEVRRLEQRLAVAKGDEDRARAAGDANAASSLSSAARRRTPSRLFSEPSRPSASSRSAATSPGLPPEQARRPRRFTLTGGKARA